MCIFILFEQINYEEITTYALCKQFEKNIVNMTFDNLFIKFVIRISFFCILSEVLYMSMAIYNQWLPLQGLFKCSLTFEINANIHSVYG